MPVTKKTYKPKKCRVCPVMFTPVRTFQTVCSLECSIKVGQQKLEAKAKKEWRKEKKIITETLKKRSDWEKELQDEVNAIIRLIDAGHPCISGGKLYGQSQAGHYYGRQAHPEIRYHLFNVYHQTAHENNHKSGNPIGYKEGLIKAFGAAHFDFVEGLKGKYEPLKLTVDEIKAKTVIAKRIVKWLKLQDRKFTNEERISLRHRFNQELGIYQY